MMREVSRHSIEIETHEQGKSDCVSIAHIYDVVALQPIIGKLEWLSLPLSH